MHVLCETLHSYVLKRVTFRPGNGTLVFSGAPGAAYPAISVNGEELTACLNVTKWSNKACNETAVPSIPTGPTPPASRPRCAGTWVLTGESRHQHRCCRLLLRPGYLTGPAQACARFCHTSSPFLYHPCVMPHVPHMAVLLSSVEP